MHVCLSARARACVCVYKFPGTQFFNHYYYCYEHKLEYLQHFVIHDTGKSLDEMTLDELDEKEDEIDEEEERLFEEYRCVLYLLFF